MRWVFTGSYKIYYGNFIGVQGMTTTNSLISDEVQPDHSFELGDLLVHYLEQLRVDYIFGVPGGAIEPLYNALARSARRGGPRAIVARHETGAAFMADGYSKETGRLAVCCATTGPGATNLLTGVASAYSNGTPMLVITGQSALPGFGCGAFQDSSCSGVDTVALFKCCTRYSTLVSHPGQLEQKLITAISTALGSSPGPVHLGIPMDVLRQPSPAPQGGDFRQALERPAMYCRQKVDQLAPMLMDSAGTVFIIGAGACGAEREVIRVAERLGALIVVAPHAKGLIDPAHPGFRGILGYGGHDSAMTALEPSRCRTIVCVGTHVSERAGKGWLKQLDSGQRLIHIDSRESHFAHMPAAAFKVQGCIASIFEQLTARFDEWDLPYRFSTNGEHAAGIQFELLDEAACHSDAAPIKPQCLMRELPSIFPPDTRYLVDSGAGLAWALHYLHGNPGGGDRKTARRSGASSLCANWFRATVEFTAMGWAIGAAVGTALGSEGPVVCITGDGSLLMSGQEITVAVQEKLPVVFVVLNDAAMGMVKHGQRLTGAAPIGFEMPSLNYARFAEDLGARGYRIEAPDALRSLNGRELFDADGPTLLDICIDPEAVPPFASRINTLVAAEVDL